MLAVLFEVRPKSEGYDAYLSLAANLRPVLDRAPGFLFIDRFRNLRDPAVILSYQHWTDEAALKQWRNVTEHDAAQHAGRGKLFEDYRLRIAEMVDAPAFESTSAAPHVVIVASRGAACDEATDAFESIYNPGRFVSLFDAPDLRAAQALAENAIAPAGTIEDRHVCAIVRDYGMFARDQAPADLRARHDHLVHGR